ncbi:MAG: N-carbamoylputrescine amidase [Lachnospiraceae bacterium]
MRKITVACVQMAVTWDRAKTLERVQAKIREAAGRGARIVLLQELFETPYFCQLQKYEYLDLATTIETNPAIRALRPLAAELSVVLPVSFLERAPSGNLFYNSVAVIDADGSLLPGIYRKSHIPDGHCYEEKFYFSPGDTGFFVWDTKYAKLGIGICWDQWFPETARCLALMGAELLLFPTAIGSEPVLHMDSCAQWQRVMQGHAAANMVPVLAANRVGTEMESADGSRFGENPKDKTKPVSAMTFYGSSFITDETGQILAQASREDEEVITAELDLERAGMARRSWGVYRDRRPDLYSRLLEK